MKLYQTSLVALTVAGQGCLDKFGTCPSIISTCKNDPNMKQEACESLCSMCEKTCGRCVPDYGAPKPKVTASANDSAKAAVNISTMAPMVEIDEPTTQPMTTLDEHGFNPAQMREIQRPNSHDSFPCEKDQARYMQTGTGFNPMCDENGHYYPVQCETKTYSTSSQTYEECFCVDIWDGARTLGSNEIIFGSGADDKKMAMENKCAPPFGYLQEIENRKKTSEWNQNFESKSDKTVPPCTKKYNELEAANKIIAEKNTVYTSFGKIEDLPDCDDGGFYEALQCDTKTKYCWCSDRVGNEIKDTRKFIFNSRSSKPVCTSVYNSKFSPTSSPATGPCSKQVSVPGRPKLECDQSGFYKDVQKDSQGRRYCHDKNNGLRNTAYMVDFNVDEMEFYCMLKPTTTQTTTTEDPIMASARAKAMAERQKAQQLMMQQQLQQKLMTKMESKVQAIQDPIKKELMSQMMGISAQPAAPSGAQIITQYSVPSGLQTSGIQTQLISKYSQPSIQTFGSVGTSYKPSSYFPSSSYTGSSAGASAGASSNNYGAYVPSSSYTGSSSSASAGASANNYGAYVPGNSNTANAYADASATSSGGATSWSSASSSSQVVPSNSNTDWSNLFGMFGRKK